MAVFMNAGGDAIGTWTDPTAAEDTRAYEDVEVQVVGTPSAAYTPQRSLDGTNYKAVQVFDQANSAYVSTIAAEGFYSLRGGCWWKLTGGAGSTFTIRAGG